MLVSRILISLAVLFAFLSSFALGQELRGRYKILTSYKGTVSLKQISLGHSGTGVLTYYRSDLGPNKPSLIVRLIKQSQASTTIAEIYDAPTGFKFVPNEIVGGEFNQSTRLNPTIVIESLDGWWVKGGKQSYNLNINTFGPIRSSFHAAVHNTYISSGQNQLSIKIRDPNHEGIPLWDLRELVPYKDSRRGFRRVSYAERKCPSPTIRENNFVPLWPFVAPGGGSFVQPVGKLNAPIIVDWADSKIVTFSELVSVRNQNCSYSIYSISPLRKGKLNSLNFETPFTFYDLSEQGVGYPNLILRTTRSVEGDVLFSNEGLGRTLFVTPRDGKRIRYSWRNEVGDSLWDYKIEVLGFGRYNQRTAIAGNSFLIDAPSYETFPKWVIAQKWPAATFVDTEGRSYRSSEGIYEYSPEFLGNRYLYGFSDKPTNTSFTETDPGFRAEYRYTKSRRPLLYFSPIDNRLHLLGAEGGSWQVNKQSKMKLLKLSNDPYIDYWRLDKGDQTEEIINLGKYIIYSNGKNITIKRNRLLQASFIITPPTNPNSWRTFRSKMLPLESRQSDPLDLNSWINHQPQKRLEIFGASLTKPYYENGRYNFILGVKPSYSINNELGVSVFSKLKPGKYAVQYDVSSGEWLVDVGIEPLLEATLIDTNASFMEYHPTTVQVRLRNYGNIAWRGRVEVSLDNRVMKTWTNLMVPGKSSQNQRLDLAIGSRQTNSLKVNMGNKSFSLGQLNVVKSRRIGSSGANSILFDDKQIYASTTLIILLAILAAVTIFVIKPPRGG